MKIKGMSFGAELEVGDVDKRVPVPPELGHWAQTETDVVNIHGSMRGIATDPIALDHPWGGEINTVPADSARKAGERVSHIIDWLHSVPQNKPSYTSMNAAHIHVRVPGLKDSLPDLLRLARYLKANFDDLIELQYMVGYQPPKWTKESRVAHVIPLDGKRRVPDWMWDNIEFFADSPERFFELFRKGKDGQTNYRPFRYGVHVYNLTMMDTVEFRCFRMTLDPEIWASLFLFVERFMIEALTTQQPVREYLGEYRFPPFIPHDLEMLQAWERTRYDKSRHAHVVRRSLREAT